MEFWVLSRLQCQQHATSSNQGAMLYMTESRRCRKPEFSFSGGTLLIAQPLALLCHRTYFLIPLKAIK